MSDLLALLRAHDLPATHVLGAGMEGTVVALEDDLVAKVWHHATGPDLEARRRFSAALDLGGAGFDVPRVLDVVDLGGTWASVQPHLAGTPLWDRPGVSPPLDDRLVGAVTAVLDGLARVPVVPDLAVLPVLPGAAPFDPAVPFGTSLAALVEERAGEVLRARLPGADRVVGAVTGALRALPEVAPRLLHGDLVPANILVDDDGRVSGVLDLGFLTTLGDPAFDAAVTASVTDMYGASARRTEAALDRVLGHPPERVAAHRLAYALVTATCYSASGSDGHFAWCLAQLERPELREVVGA